MRLPCGCLVLFSSVTRRKRRAASGEATTSSTRRVRRRCRASSSSRPRLRRENRVRFRLRFINTISLQVHLVYHKYILLFGQVPFAGGLTTICSSLILEHVLFGPPRRGSQSQPPGAAASRSAVSSLCPGAGHPSSAGERTARGGARELAVRGASRGATPRGTPKTTASSAKRGATSS